MDDFAALVAGLDGFSVAVGLALGLLFAVGYVALTYAQPAIKSLSIGAGTTEDVIQQPFFGSAAK